MVEEQSLHYLIVTTGCREVQCRVRRSVLCVNAATIIQNLERKFVFILTVIYEQSLIYLQSRLDPHRQNLVRQQASLAFLLEGRPLTFLSLACCVTLMTFRSLVCVCSCY
jgi:hypothetical protein